MRYPRAMSSSAMAFNGLELSSNGIDTNAMYAASKRLLVPSADCKQQQSTTSSRSNTRQLLRAAMLRQVPTAAKTPIYLYLLTGSPRRLVLVRRGASVYDEVRNRADTVALKHRSMDQVDSHGAAVVRIKPLLCLGK